MLHQHLPQMHLIGEAIGFLDLFQFRWAEVFGKAGGQLGDRGNPHRALCGLFDARGGFG